MNKKTILTTLAFSFSLVLASCTLLPSAKSNKNGDNNNGNVIDSNIQLIYAGRPLFEYNSPDVDKLLELNQQDRACKSDYSDGYFYGTEIEIDILNPDHLSFLDMMVYSDCTSNRYIYKDGNGDYNASVSTSFRKDDWITTIRLYLAQETMQIGQNDSCLFDTYIKIEEINFLNTNGSVAKADIEFYEQEVVDIHAIDISPYKHKWDIVYDIEPTCTSSGIMTRICSVCGREEMGVEAPALGHDCGNYTIINKIGNILQTGDRIVGERACSRCGKTISETLPELTQNINLVIPDSITSIGSSAFNGSTGLLSVVIPSSVTSIGDTAFGSCYNLKTVYFKATTPPRIGSDLFCGTWDADDFVIYVPRESLNAYKSITAEFWQDYAVRRIQPYDY